MDNLRLVKREHSLVYAIKMIPDEILPEQEHPNIEIHFPGGRKEKMTTHVITGGKDEIKQKLCESVDAFFEIFAEDL